MEYSNPIGVVHQIGQKWMETNPSIKYFHKVFFGKLYLVWEMNYIFGKEKFEITPISSKQQFCPLLDRYACNTRALLVMFTILSYFICKVLLQNKVNLVKVKIFEEKTTHFVELLLWGSSPYCKQNMIKSRLNFYRPSWKHPPKSE